MNEMTSINAEPYIVYVRADSAGCITDVSSSAFLTDAEGWAKIDSGHGYSYHHAQGNYLPGPLYDDRGICRYKLVDGKPVERTAEEMDADFAARPVQGATQLDRIEAQTLYTALMTDTLIEEV